MGADAHASNALGYGKPPFSILRDVHAGSIPVPDLLVRRVCGLISEPSNSLYSIDERASDHT